MKKNLTRFFMLITDSSEKRGLNALNFEQCLVHFIWVSCTSNEVSVSDNLIIIFFSMEKPLSKSFFFRLRLYFWCGCIYMYRAGGQNWPQ